MCMERQDAALCAAAVAWAHSMLIKPLQITSDISPIITCQSLFFLFQFGWFEFSGACVCVCVLVCECTHMLTWEQTADLFQHAGYGFHFCLLFPLSCAFSLKLESDLSQHRSFALTKADACTHTNRDTETQKFVLLGVKLILPTSKQNFLIDCVDLFNYCCCDLINHYVCASSFKLFSRKSPLQ